MASSSSHMASSSFASVPQWEYDVFLSFRGEDTRLNFTDHLYSAMSQRGITAFKDDQKLERGKGVAPELVKAIEKSRFAIIIISRNYASSRWCLDELVKILECQDKMGQKILPIFYGVEPSDVRKQSGSFQEAFAKHEEDNTAKVEVWRSVLTKVGNLSGWTSQNRKESELIKEVVDKVWDELKRTFPSTSKPLIGMDAHVKEMNGLFGEGSNDVRFVGICGMGGLGKTTIARVYYDRVRWQFDGSCFLDVKDAFDKDGQRHLQEQLLSQVLMKQSIKIWDAQKGIVEIKKRLQHKKIVLVLDNIDKSEQLEVLAVNHGWLSPGSRIIITTRDRHLLKPIGVYGVYELKEMDDDNALILFSWKAFKEDQPTLDYLKLSKRVVNYAKGLPLALEVLGSFLHGRSITEWESAIARLNEIPNKEIVDVLKVSYDGLEDFERMIFLDIACFFKGMNIHRVTAILNSCGFYADIGIPVLIDKSLMTVSENKIQMHDLLQLMGREIVRRESPEQPGRRSRLWTNDDIFHLLREGGGREEVQGVFLEPFSREEGEWSPEAFSKLTKLRLLKIHNVYGVPGPTYLSNELRFLHWHRYPSKSLPSCFKPDKLCELEMSESRIQKLLDGSKILNNLRIINLSHCRYLTTTPDFTGIPNLEELILAHCTRLYEVHPSLQHLKKLIYLDLEYCKSLKSLPSNLQAESLKVFELRGCSKLKNFPDFGGDIKCLSLRGCKKLECLPSSIGGLKSLKTLDLSGCCRLANLPDTFEGLESLEKLNVNGTAIRFPPASIFRLRNLKELLFREYAGEPSNWMRKFFECWSSSFQIMPRTSSNPMALVLPSFAGLCSLTKLDLSYCNLGEGAFPDDLGFLSLLKVLTLDGNNFVSLPKSINQLSSLVLLYLNNCKMLQSLTEIPSKCEVVDLDSCTSLQEMPDRCNQERLLFSCQGCLKLSRNLAFTMLRGYIQDLSKAKLRFDIIVPGRGIPEWFTHQSEGSFISLQMPRNFFSPNTESESGCMGFAVCVAFKWTGRDVWTMISLAVTPDGKSPMTCWHKCDVGLFKHAANHHHWSFYISFANYRKWRDQCFNRLDLQLYFISPGIKLRRWGARLVYGQDAQEFNH